jgi:D-alanyl-lipoteichoic acid acyltransferase DltB (MBOAT superfamily)
MLFNSQQFILLFLPITFLLFLLTWRRMGRTPALVWLVLASLFFYGWWNPNYVPLLAGSVLVNFLLARGMVHTRRRSRRRFALLTLGVAFNLGLLGYFKYSGFLLENIGGIAETGFTIAAATLPLAISFYTFQQISYLVDVWRNRGREYDLLRYAAYVTFFPQLIAGPIVRHYELIPQFDLDPLRQGLWERISRGSILFAIGLIKKVLIADHLAEIVDPAFAAAATDGGLTFTAAWLAAFAFSWQIYFDFSGYSDMAIGLALMFGYRLPINFNAPYRAASLQEFWQCWHMTLSRFLRDYLFVSLARSKRLIAHSGIVAVLVTMFLGGLWHGAAWTFAVWGLAHGVGLILNAGFSRAGLRLPKGMGWLLTLLFWVEITVLFRADSFATAAVFWRTMHDLTGPISPMDARSLALVIAAGLIAIAGPTSQEIALERLSPNRWYALAAGLAVAVAIVLTGGGDAQEFYYFQF